MGNMNTRWGWTCQGCKGFATYNPCEHCGHNYDEATRPQDSPGSTGFDGCKAPTFAGVQSAIVVEMRDLCDNADDTVWITDHETMFERLCELYEIAGGKKETLAGIWPEYF